MKIKHIVTAVVSGSLLGVTFTQHMWWLSIVAICALYVNLGETQRLKRIQFCTFFAAGYFATLLWWIRVLGVDVYILLVILCVVLFLPIALVSITKNPVLGPIEFASLWLLVEFIRSQVPFGGFPWGLVGYSQIDGPLASFARVGGTGAVAFVVCVCAGFIVEIFRFKSLTFLVIPILLMMVSHMVPQVTGDTSMKVAAVQGSVPRTGLNDYAQRVNVLTRHVNQTLQHKSQLQDTDLVVWPESAAGVDPLHDNYANRLIQNMVNEVNTPFLIGGTVWQGSQNAPHNVGILWLPFQGPTDMYVKNHLVPFGEYVPFRNTLTRYIARLERVPEDFAQGDGGGVFTIGNLKFGDAICFEVAYGGHISELVSQGAALLTAQSNNSTYLGTSQPYQQFEITRFRALEHGRAVVVATTTGKSGIISSTGKVQVASKNSGGEVVIANVNTSTQKALVDRMPPNLFEILACICLVLVGGLKRKKITKTWVVNQNESVPKTIGSDGD